MAQFINAAPTFVVADVVKTAEYYRDALGFSIQGYFLDPPVFAIVTRDGVILHFAKSDTGAMQTNKRLRPIAADTYIWVSDIDSLHQELLSKNVPIIEGPIKRVYESTEIVITDCNGFRLVFGN